jgi:hypothetical protein
MAQYNAFRDPDELLESLGVNSRLHSSSLWIIDSRCVIIN